MNNHPFAQGQLSRVGPPRAEQPSGGHVAHMVAAIIVSGVGLLLMADSARASLYSFASVNVTDHPNCNQSGTNDPITVTCASGGGYDYAHAMTTLAPSYGHLAIDASTAVSSDLLFNNRSASITTRAGFWDTLTISNAALTNQRGRMTFSYLVDADFDDGGSAITNPLGAFSARGTAVRSIINVSGNQFVTTESVSTRLDAFSNGDSRTTTNRQSIVNGVSAESGLGLFTYFVDFIFGQAFTLNMELSIYANSGVANLASAFAEVDATRSLDWAGIQSISFNGIELDDYTLTSLSGTDWRNSLVPAPPAAVPEPGSLALTGLALALLAALFVRGNVPSRLRSGPGWRHAA